MLTSAATRLARPYPLLRAPFLADAAAILLAAFLSPVFIAALASQMGFPISGRDDQNYISELESRDTFSLDLDVASWTLLSLASDVAGVSPEVLRWMGFALAVAIVWLVKQRTNDNAMISLLVISLLPLYLNLFFNQFRLAIGLLLFLFFLTAKHGRILAAPIATLGHSSFLLTFFPPLVLVVPFVTYALERLDPDTIGAAKLLAYAEADEVNMPWYFGWEIAALAGLLLMVSRVRLCLELAAFAWAARTLAGEFSVDIGRRVLEVALIAYSPVILLLWRGVLPSKAALAYYLCLGVLQIALGLSAGVVVLG